MIFDETRPCRSNIGGCADEEKNDDDHTIEAEEGTLNKETPTIV